MKPGVIRTEHLIVAVLVVVILGIGVTVPSIIFNQDYSELPVEAAWTAVASDTPTRTIAPPESAV